MSVVAAGCGGGRASPDRLYLGADFTQQPVATGATVRVQLQLPDGFLYGNVDGELTVRDSAGNEVSATKTTAGRFELVLPTAGQYTFSAKSGSETSTVTVKAEDIAELGLVARTLHTTVEGSEKCGVVVGPGTNPITLAPNQRLSVDVGARSASGATMIGIYDLEVLDIGVHVSRPFLLGGPNELSITTTANGSARFTERKSGKSVKQDIFITEQAATCQ